MKNLLTISLILISLSTSLAQSVVVGPVVRRPAMAGTFTLSRNAVTGFLELTPKTGSPFLVAVDSSQVRGLSARFSQVQLGINANTNALTTTTGRLNGLDASVAGVYTKGQADLLFLSQGYVPTYGSITGKPTLFPSARSVSPDLDTAIANRATKAEVSRILSGTTSPDQSAYSRTSTDFLLAQKASLTTTTTALATKRDKFSDGRSLPVDFGVVGDSLTDDGPALLSMVQSATGREMYLPPGVYRSSVALTRTNGGSFTLRGAGMGKTRIVFSGDTDGIRVVNPLNGNYGGVLVTDLAIETSGPKSTTGTGRTALLITTQHEGPGPTVERVKFSEPKLTAHEWTTGLNYHDCSHTYTANIDAMGKGFVTMTGVLITNSPNRPSVEHTLVGTNIRNTYRALSVISAATGSLGVEGVQIITPNIVNVRQGVFAKTFQSSPQLTFIGGHIQSTGGEALFIDGYQQVAFVSPLIYSYRDAGANLTPLRSVYINNAVVVNGKLTINLSDNTPYALELAGTGGVVDLDLYNITSAAPTNLVSVAPGYTGGVTMGLDRTWTGATTYGTTQGGLITDPGNVIRRKMYLAPGAFNPAALSHLRYDASAGWKAVSPVVANSFQDGVFVSGSQTIDPSLFNMIRIGNGATAITITIDNTKLTQGQTITLKRVNDTSTGTITIQCANSVNNKIESATGAMGATFLLPTTAGNRSATFYFDGADLQLIR